MFRLSDRSINTLEGIDKILRMIAVGGLTCSPIDYGIPPTGGLRTPEEQFVLFSRGVSKCDGYKKKSYHQTGRAFDIYAFVDGKATWDVQYYEPIARHLQEYALKMYGIELTWGGDFQSFIDMPHFQI